MDKRTEFVQRLIDENWKSRRQFALSIGLPPTTLNSILERGIGKASVDNVLLICEGLGISADDLQKQSEDQFIVNDSKTSYVTTIAAHIDDNVTDEEMEEIKNYIEYIKSKRK